MTTKCVIKSGSQFLTPKFRWCEEYPEALKCSPAKALQVTAGMDESTFQIIADYGLDTQHEINPSTEVAAGKGAE